MKDIEISENATLEPITKIAEKAGFTIDQIEPYGNYKAKINIYNSNSKLKEDGKLILVTSINPTPAGEGKSTVSVGLGDALQSKTGSAMIALREPSLGPVMGMKGGATGGGYSQVVPMEDINLHFTGDMHALTSANNTLAALIDNHIQQGNELNIDPRTITWKRTLDINDRELRRVVIGLGGRTSGVPREDGFDITVASELMAILCLAENITDLKKRINSILVGQTYDRKSIFVKDLGVGGAITALLKDAIKPNLVQTLEHTPALIHGGPFANIAHGCNSVIATRTALEHADYVVTEAGFGADLGAEKFLDIKTPVLGKTPDTIVIVATVRALKYNGGVLLKDLETENLAALEKGFVNLQRHINNMKQFGVPLVVAINRFTSDTDDEVKMLTKLTKEENVDAVEATVWKDGGKGAQALAKLVIENTAKESHFKRLYDNNSSLQNKIETIVKNVYGGKNVEFSSKALNKIKQFKSNDWEQLPICVAKTQYSFSDDPKLLGAPRDFTIHVSDLNVKLGAGFIVVMTGNVLTMPGLPKKPAALNIDVDDNGKISGVF